jgi:hypothetical protein
MIIKRQLMKGKKKAQSGRDAGERADGSDGKVLLFPSRNVMEPSSRESVIADLSRSGVTLEPGLLRLLRLPRLMVRGMNEKLEFFDVLSNQPFPASMEDSPPRCYGKSKAPSWVSQRYLAVTEEEGKKFLTFIDTPREIFIKEDLADQASIRSILYEKIMAVGQAPAQ